MARVYSSARGNQGVAPGMIFPFSRECQTVSVKNERVPGGYLRCDGPSIKQGTILNLRELLALEIVVAEVSVLVGILLALLEEPF